MKIAYKATLEIEQFSRSGWDSDVDTSLIHLYNDNLDALKHEVDTCIKDNTRSSVGDFGITLSRCSAKLLKIEKIKPEQVISVVKI